MKHDGLGVLHRLFEDCVRSVFELNAYDEPNAYGTEAISAH